MKKIKKSIILMLIFMMILSVCNCNKKKTKDLNQKTVEQEIIIPDRNKEASLSFELNKRVQIEEVVHPQIAISHILNGVYVYGDYISAEPKIVIKIYNHQLENISQKIFNLGKGPGDLGLVNYIKPVGEELLIRENSNIRFSTYDNNLNYKKSLQFKDGNNLPLDIFGDGDYRMRFELSWSKGEKKRVVTFKMVSKDEEGRGFWENSFLHPSHNKGKLVLDNTSNFSYFQKDQEIYFLIMKDYRILLINMEGAILRDVLVKVEPVKTQKDKMKENLLDQGYKPSRSFQFIFSDTVASTSWMIPLEKGFIVVRRNNYSSACSGMAEGDYFSYNIEYLGKVKIPCYYWMYRISQYMLLCMRCCTFYNGYLYLVNEVDEKILLEKWEVKY